MKKLLVILLIVAIFVLVGCSAQATTSSEVASPLSTYSGVKVYGDSNFTVVRFTDAEKNVTCWLMDGAYSGGIFCLPND